MSAQPAGDLAQIGKSVVIKGELSGSEDRYVDGQVGCSIALKGNSLTVGPHGQVKANVEAKGVVIQGKFTHTFKGAAPQTGGPGSVWSQPARQVHDDKCEEGADCIVAALFHGKLDFKPVHMKTQ